jgi:hypothetical protein
MFIAKLEGLGLNDKRLHQEGLPRADKRDFAKD